MTPRTGGSPPGSPAAGSTPAPGAPPPTASDAPNLPAFSCGADVAGGTPRRLWRLTPTQYRNTVAAFLKGRKSAKRQVSVPANLIAPLGAVDDSYRFGTFSGVHSISDFELRRALNQTVETSGMVVAQLKQEAGNCLTSGTIPFGDCMTDLVTKRGPILFQRPLTPAEVSEYSRLATDNAAALGQDDAAALAFQAMLQAPAFLFRTELGEGVPDASGLVKLTPYETAAALSFSLTDWPPDEELWTAASKNELATPEQLKAQVARLIDNLSGRYPSIYDLTGTAYSVQRFVRQYFGYDNVLLVNKTVPDFNRGSLYHETEAFVAELVKTNGRKDFLGSLLTSTMGFTSTPTFRTYNLPDPKNYDGVKVTFDPAQRAGMLTQPAFLAAYSKMDETMPVKRGHFLSESLLCRSVPELPIGVVPQLPDLGKNATARDRLSVHSAKPECNACHHLMDPLGLAFEVYDHTGKWVGPAGVGKPVDASGMLTDSGDQDGPFKDALELTQRLAKSKAVEQCFVRHSFRYWMGRNEQPFDACAIVAADQAFRDSGGDYLALLQALFTSRSFLYRSTKAETP